MQAFLESLTAWKGETAMNKSGGILRGRRLAAMLAASILMFSLVVFVPALRGWMAMIPAGILAAAFGVGFFAFGRQSGSRGRTIASFVLAVVLILAALVWGTHFVSSKLLRTQALADGQTRAVTGYISEVLYEKPYGAAYDVTLVTVDGEPMKGKARLSVPFSEGLSVYDTVSFSGVFAENDPTYDAYMKSRGIFISVSAEEMTRTGVKKRDLSRIFSDIRMAIADNFERFIGGDEAGFATALFTGNHDALDGQTRLAFRRLGISHLLAVSGLHLSIVVGGADFLLRTLTVPRRKKNVILILLTLFFAAICGFSASIMRAAIMLCILRSFSENGAIP